MVKYPQVPILKKASIGKPKQDMHQLAKNEQTRQQADADANVLGTQVTGGDRRILKGLHTKDWSSTRTSADPVAVLLLRLEHNHEFSWFGVTFQINGDDKLVFCGVHAKLVQEILSELVNFLRTSRWAYEAEVDRRQAQLGLRDCVAIVLGSLHGLRRAHGVRHGSNNWHYGTTQEKQIKFREQGGVVATKRCAVALRWVSAISQGPGRRRVASWYNCWPVSDASSTWSSRVPRCRR